jgi:flagellin
MLLWSSSTTGNMSTTVGTENFTGHIAPVVNGDMSTATLTGDQGHNITLHYKQADTGASQSQIAMDMYLATFDFSDSSATTTGITSAPTTVAGTYTFSSTLPWKITLTGSGVGNPTQTINVGDIAANGTGTLSFNNLGISVTLHADGGLGGFTKEAIIASLLKPADDTIVVTSSGVPGAQAIIATTANTGANFQIGATGNAVDALGVTFADARVTNNTSTTAGYGTLAADIATFATATGNGNGIVAAAQTLINSTDVGISFVSTVRGNLGAVQNRLEHTTASISVASENLNASESRIRDLDVASEMVNFTKTQILQQAGTAILAQANSAPQNILTLLR